MFIPEFGSLKIIVQLIGLIQLICAVMWAIWEQSTHEIEIILGICEQMSF